LKKEAEGDFERGKESLERRTKKKQHRIYFISGERKALPRNRVGKDIRIILTGKKKGEAIGFLDKKTVW